MLETTKLETCTIEVKCQHCRKQKTVYCNDGDTLSDMPELAKWGISSPYGGGSQSFLCPVCFASDLRRRKKAD